MTPDEATAREMVEKVNIDRRILVLNPIQLAKVGPYVDDYIGDCEIVASDMLPTMSPKSLNVDEPQAPRNRKERRAFRSKKP